MKFKDLLTTTGNWYGCYLFKKSDSPLTADTICVFRTKDRKLDDDYYFLCTCSYVWDWAFNKVQDSTAKPKEAFKTDLQDLIDLLNIVDQETT